MKNDRWSFFLNKKLEINSFNHCIDFIILFKMAKDIFVVFDNSSFTFQFTNLHMIFILSIDNAIIFEIFIYTIYIKNDFIIFLINKRRKKIKS